MTVDPVIEAWTAVAENRARKELRKVAPESKPAEKPTTKPNKFDRN